MNSNSLDFVVFVYFCSSLICTNLFLIYRIFGIFGAKVLLKFDTKKTTFITVPADRLNPPDEDMKPNRKTKQIKVKES